MRAFITLKDFFSEHKWSYMLGVFWLLIIDSIQLIVPQILRSLTNAFEKNMLTINGIIKYSLLIILTGVIIAVGRYFWRIYILGTSRILEYYLRDKFFNHLLTLSPNYFNTHKTGDLMAHATNDVNAVRMAIGQGTIMIVDSIFLIILSLIMMIKTTNLRLTVIALFTLPFIIIVVSRFGKIIHKRFRIVQEAFSDLTDTTQENFAGIRVIKSFVQEDLVKENFTQVNKDNLKKNLNLVKISGTFHPFIQFISSISFLLVIWYGGKQVILNEISLGDFIAFNSYLGLLIWPMMAVGWVINILQRGAASMERINSILDEKPDIVDNSNAISLNRVKGKIEFKNVSFKYPNATNYALKNINFTIEGGKSLAIVGKTGSGKTSIVNLLLRLYDIEEGNIYLDNNNIKNVTLKSLRENVGYVPQDNFLFSTTIEDNIGFAFDNKVASEKVFNAAQLAEVYDNIIAFPNGFETVLGERGVTLSGGQKQRTSIARAIIKEPPIIILDDSLSSVDTETEEKILKNLEKIMDNKTTIIISHRISTVKAADEIILLEDGKIIERGNHEELLTLEGLYKDLYEKQLLEEKLNRQ
ncbi:ABC transporter ATP-binding protein/permease [Tissierella sp. MSJ-40]|uniref:ABC transporter ATP-binding protein/permease n=1 Tax=Tissierella simiarum TaxID=2841534 RepID=A0ABS6E5E3_9FIRM|nr:ABC transporter ATP-binding protein [Tissierella simiarum]MBU5437468.1 ABC transporter ATP-binding protein/permease [Tissierella simiarum]